MIQQRPLANPVATQLQLRTMRGQHTNHETAVAVLAAVEMVRTKMPATLDGAILAKTADRGQIVSGVVDGPLDLDAAVDAEAARIKHIASPVAGLADVLIVPNIEAGNMVYKNLAFMADAQTAGPVCGCR
jgi:phosphate acetyltransferase